MTRLNVMTHEESKENRAVIDSMASQDGELMTYIQALNKQRDVNQMLMFNQE